MQRFSTPISRLFLLLILGISALTAQLFLPGQQSTASAATNTTLNKIQTENLLPGTTNWGITNPSPDDATNFTNDKGIEGYAQSTSVAAGGKIGFAVNTTAATFKADIYRLGWYQGTGARLVKTIANIAGHSYPIYVPNSKTGLNQALWPTAFTVSVPTTWVSGMYLVRLTDANKWQSYLSFTVTTTRNSSFVLVHSVNTEAAYNIWGGASMYSAPSLAAGRAYQVSLDRPFYGNLGAGYLLSWEYPMIRWMEKNGYDVSYVTDVNVHENASVLLGHKGILVVGHSEYWSQAMRNNLEAAINSGVNLGAFGGNQIYWQIRYDRSYTNVLDRVITAYKDASLDPVAATYQSQTTVQFRQAPLNNPEQNLLGSQFNSYFVEGSSNHGFPWVVSNASSWIFAGTNLKNGDALPGMVGYEFDSYSTQTAAPASKIGADGVGGVEVLSSSPVTDVYGNQVMSNSTLYTRPNGARVFNAGTIQWSWGLDNWSLSTMPSAVSPAVQQITANILNNFLTK